MSAIELRSLKKSFDKTEVLRDISLKISSGEFIAVLGPSGCGKTTLLRVMAGFEVLNSGSIFIDGIEVSGPRTQLPPEKRNTGIVFQNYALWPHMSVAENVGYGLKVSGIKRKELNARVNLALETVNLADMDKRSPAELSGGQRQRVALARCLAIKSRVILLDEPLANLDVHLRSAMEEEFANFHASSGATMLYITHDQSEAMSLADKVAVMDQGKIVQFATPRTLFREPANQMVAGFIGEGRVIEVEDLSPIGNGHAKANLFGAEVTLRCSSNEKAAKRAHICLHPDDLKLVESGTPFNRKTADHSNTGRLEAVIRIMRYRGGYFQIELIAGPASNIILPLTVPVETSLNKGQTVSIELRDGWVIPNSNC
jgi:iron(III) transport system ATP-binding protein